MYFRSYRLRKALKSQVPEHLRTVIMLKGHEHPSNLHGGSFVMFFHHSEKTSVQKILSYWYLKS